MQQRSADLMQQRSADLMQWLADLMQQRSADLVRPEKFQFMEKWQNRNFDYKVVNFG